MSTAPNDAAASSLNDATTRQWANQCASSCIYDAIKQAAECDREDHGCLCSQGPLKGVEDRSREGIEDKCGKGIPHVVFAARAAWCERKINGKNPPVTEFMASKAAVDNPAAFAAPIPPTSPSPPISANSPSASAAISSDSPSHQSGPPTSAVVAVAATLGAVMGLLLLCVAPLLLWRSRRRKQRLQQAAKDSRSESSSSASPQLNPGWRNGPRTYTTNSSSLGNTLTSDSRLALPSPLSLSNSRQDSLVSSVGPHQRLNGHEMYGRNVRAEAVGDTRVVQELQAVSGPHEMA